MSLEPISVGTGPFMMKEWKTDEAVEFVRSEKFLGRRSLS